LRPEAFRQSADCFQIKLRKTAAGTGTGTTTAPLRTSLRLELP
jgi:hypothetical protein